MATQTTTMRAITQDRYGDSGSYSLRTVPIPEIESDQVLIRVHAAALNPYDWHMMTGSPWIVRFQNGLRRPKAPVGMDGAGVVEAVGDEVTDVSPGDEVWGPMRGSCAEFATSRGVLISKPDRLTFEQAAGISMAATTAYQGLVKIGGLRAGQRVLVNGASGGVGTFAVMIAKALGAHVTAVCSTRNLDLVRSIGADRAVDYTTTDYSREDAEYDVILDTVTTKGIVANRRAMAPESTWVQAGMKKKRSVLMLILRTLKLRVANIGSGKKMRMYVANYDSDDMHTLGAMLESGQITPVIDRTYPLAETAAAMDYLAEGHARGKVIITTA